MNLALAPLCKPTSRLYQDEMCTPSQLLQSPHYSQAGFSQQDTAQQRREIGIIIES